MVNGQTDTLNPNQCFERKYGNKTHVGQTLKIMRGKKHNYNQLEISKMSIN